MLKTWFETAPQLIDVAMGRSPADMVIRKGRWVNVHSGEIIPDTDIAIIAQGKLLAAGELNELRKGIKLNEDGEGPVSLEEYFIHVVGGTRSSGEEEVLQWLT